MRKIILVVLALMLCTGCGKTKENNRAKAENETIINETVLYENIIYETFETQTTYWD